MIIYSIFVAKNVYLPVNPIFSLNDVLDLSAVPPTIATDITQKTNIAMDKPCF